MYPVVEVTLFVGVRAKPTRVADRPAWVFRLPSPVYSVTVLAVLVAVVALLDVGARPPTGAPPDDLGRPVDAGSAMAFNDAWLTWRAVAAIAIVIFVYGLLAGIVLLRRSVQSRVLPASSWRVGCYLTVPALLVVAAIAMLVTSGGRNPDLPVHLLAWRTRTVLFTGLVSVVPWMALAWLCQDRSRPRDYRPWGATDPELGFEDLSRLWRLVTMCIGAFAVGVAAAVLTSGALRFAFLAGRPQCGPQYTPPAGAEPAPCVEGFPAVSVLLYGAAYAVIGLSLAVPLIATWRASAFAWVERRRPPDSSNDADSWIQEKNRLFEVLHLNTPVLRNPLTLLSVFTPLITSTLAAFLPQLGS